MTQSTEASTSPPIQYLPSIFEFMHPSSAREYSRPVPNPLWSELVSRTSYEEAVWLEEVVWRESSWLSASSVAPQHSSQEIEQELQRLFAAARDEVFEDGMDSDFSRSLVSLIKKYGSEAFETFTIKKYGSEAFEILAGFLLGEAVNPEVVSEALRWLGYIEDPPTYHDRLRLLEHALRCSSARARDGAILGLASLDDPSAIPYIEKAIEKERIQELRRDMQQVLDQLRDTQAARM